jgi:hypothetical protein
VLGQQVLMGLMNVPAPIVTQQISVAAYGAIATKAATAPGTLTPTEQAILAQPSIPYNLDAWDGYAVARETVLGMARTLDKNQLIGPLQYAQTSLRGYMVLNLTASEARADWVFVDTIVKHEYSASTGRSLRTLPGGANRKLIAV